MCVCTACVALSPGRPVLQGAPLPVVAKLLGHAKMEMTLRCARAADREVESAAERIGRVIAGMMSGS